jgi:hypothetical protein
MLRQPPPAAQSGHMWDSRPPPVQPGHMWDSRPPASPAAERRKIAAHAVRRGWVAETERAPKGRKNPPMIFPMPPAMRLLPSLVPKTIAPHPCRCLHIE